jgi:hypothetical protein
MITHTFQVHGRTLHGRTASSHHTSSHHTCHPHACVARRGMRRASCRLMRWLIGGGTARPPPLMRINLALLRPDTGCGVAFRPGPTETAPGPGAAAPGTRKRRRGGANYPACTAEVALFFPRAIPGVYRLRCNTENGRTQPKAETRKPGRLSRNILPEAGATAG